MFMIYRHVSSYEETKPWWEEPVKGTKDFASQACQGKGVSDIDLKS